ncbi:MAG TPA: phosphatase PAP2 family protein [Kutzneria sp.]|jgi:undecaprenyl-diphosphatase
MPVALKLSVLLGVAAVVLTVAVAVSAGPLLTLDNVVASGLHTYALGHPSFVRAMQVWTDVFQPWTFRAIVIAAAVWLLWRRQVRTAAWATGTILLCGAVESGLKAWIGRARPHWTHPVSAAVGDSFPSGHALTSAAGCAVLLALAWPTLGRRSRRAWSAVAVAVPFVTGFTRLALGVHFLSDVIGGWLIAAALFAAMTLALSTDRAGQ